MMKRIFALFSFLLLGCFFMFLPGCGSGGGSGSGNGSRSGSLDASFGTGGVVTTAVGTDYNWANALLLQTDGKIVAAGNSYVSGQNVFALVRYNRDGSLDTGFGTSGVVTTAIGTLNDTVYSVALQPDGKIVAAGHSLSAGNLYGFALARYNTNGSLDATFGTGGVVTTAIGTDDAEIFSVAVQDDGKILAAGYSYNGSQYVFTLARYDATNGTLDPGFGTAGIVTTAIGSADDEIYGLAIQSDHKIVVGGYSYNGSQFVFALARYNTNGTLDAGFGTAGIVTTAVGTNDDWIMDLRLQRDGKIVASGISATATQDVFALARYNANGSLDTTFGTGGIVTTTTGSSCDHIYALDIQSDGKIVVAGASTDSSHHLQFAVARYTVSGSLDAGFGTGGVTTTTMGLLSYINAVIIQPDGKIVTAGESQDSSLHSYFALARYLP